MNDKFMDEPRYGQPRDRRAIASCARPQGKWRRGRGEGNPLERSRVRPSELEHKIERLTR